MAEFRKLCRLLMMAMVIIGSAKGANGRRYVVGADQGWDTGFNYSEWTSGKAFFVGDSLYFDYFREDHNVVQVDFEGFTTCNITNSIATYTAGRSTVELDREGTFYFVCSLGDHCLEGQRLQVSVLAKPAIPPSPDFLGPSSALNQNVPSSAASLSFAFCFLQFNSFISPPVLVLVIGWFSYLLL
ncbi:hypothetical protein KP509_02G003300 [Ceratopteris richardii]|uniref:Phytocyanin domain-containing protein n=1 Tax=Ceratopteris richardii TaxID=49495 RepID=A0A8T2V6W8_CERRI|nr:hypothetical protein KP509_02G003300 [Ceratopteris richardii]